MNRKKKTTNSFTEDAAASSKKPKKVASVRDKTKSKVVKGKVLTLNGKALKRNVKTVAAAKRPAKNNNISLAKATTSQVANEPKQSGAKRGRKPKNVKTSELVKPAKTVQNKSENVNGDVPAKRPKAGRPPLNKPKVEQSPTAATKRSASKGPSTSSAESGSNASKRSKSPVAGPSKKTTLFSAKSVTKGEKKGSKKRVSSIRKSPPKMAVSPVRSETSAGSADSAATATNSSESNKMQTSIKKTNSKSKAASSSTMCNPKGTKQNKKVVKRKQHLTGLSNKSIMSKKRGTRVASLNASAMVKLLCESDRDSFSVNSNTNSRSSDASEKSSPQARKKSTKPISKSPTTKSDNASGKSSQPRNSKSSERAGPSDKQVVRKKKSTKEEEKLTTVTAKKKKRRAKRKRNTGIDKSVEIIDTRRCKRMASLNASAMMAATYLPEARVAKTNCEVEVVIPVAQPEVSPPAPEATTTSNSTILDTIEQVVRQWSTVQQHIEISPGSSSDCNAEQNCKTTVKTTVKHVKMRGNGTVVETISTEYEQQNIMPDSASPSKPTKSRKSSKAPRVEARSAETPAASQSSSASASAFTPCSGTNLRLGSGSIDSIALLSSQPTTSTSFSSSSVSVQNYHQQLISDRADAQQSEKRSNRNKKKDNNKASRPQNESRDSSKKSRSIIQKYEVKTSIETRMESSGNEPSVHNSVLSNRVIFTNNNAATSLVNFNNAGCLPRVEPSALPCNVYPPSAPFQVVPTGPSLMQPHTAHSSELAPESGPTSALAPYINLSPFNAPLLHYQPMPGSFSPLSSTSFTSPISVPFLQLANAAHSFSSSPYGLLNHRPNPLSVSSLFGLSYLSPNGHAGLYQPANPVINILPSAPNVIHRPVAYHAQPNQVSAATNSNMSGLVNSSVFASSSLYGGGFAANPSPAINNLFQCSMIRSPSVASIRPINLPVPVAPCSQSAVFLPSTASNSTAAPSVPVATVVESSSSASPPSPSVASVAESNRSTPSPQPLVICPASLQSNDCTPNNENIDSDESTANDDHGNNTSGESEPNSNSHIQQLTNMTNNIVLRQDRLNSVDSNATATLTPRNNSDETHKSNRNKRIADTESQSSNNGIAEKNGKTNGKKSLISSKKININRDITLAKVRVIPENGFVKRGLVSNGSERKKSKLAKGVAQNGTSLKNGIAFNPYNGNRAIVADSNVEPKLPNVNTPSPVEKQAPKSESPSVVNNSPLSSARLLGPDAAVANQLKKNRRAISHGWSWDGTATERYIFINNDDQPYLRKCYSAIKHIEGEIIQVRDCVLLKSGPRKTDLPFVAKITALWESPEKEMMMSLLWYYRPEHTDIQESYIPGEVYASRHRDTNSVACIDDKCYVLTYNEFCRFKRQKVRLQQHISRKSDKSARLVPRFAWDPLYCRHNRIPPLIILPELVFCCRKVYDFRQKRILKNPNFKMICE